MKTCKSQRNFDIQKIVNRKQGHFIFHPFITEKERINKVLEPNEYTTEPIFLHSSKHNFRERDKSKEIQPEMTFSMKLKLDSGRSSAGSINFPNSKISKKKLYLKSTESMLLKLGVLHRASNKSGKSDIALYEALRDENLKEHGKYFTQMIAKEKCHMRMQTDIKNHFRDKQKFYKYYLSHYKKDQDPLMTAAEKLLLKSKLIHQKDILKFKTGRSRKKIIIGLSPEDQLKLAL